MPTTVTHTIKPAGGGDYTSIETWKSAQSRNLVTADEIAAAECYSGGNLTGNAGFRFDVSSFTADNTRYIHFYAADGEEHEGTYDTNKAYIGKTISGNAGWLWQEGLLLERLQFDHTTTGTSPFGSMWMYSNPDNLIIDRCIHRYTTSNSGTTSLLACWSNNQAGTVTVTNSIMLRHCAAASNTGYVVFAQNNAMTVTVYNCTIVHTGSTGGTHYGFGIRDTGSVGTSDNNYYGITSSGTNNSTGVITGTATMNSGNGDASNLTDVSNADLQGVAYDTGTFVDVTKNAEDLNLADASPLVDEGTTIGSVTEDIVGTVRPGGSVYDVGAFEIGALTLAPTFVGAGTWPGPCFTGTLFRRWKTERIEIAETESVTTTHFPTVRMISESLMRLDPLEGDAAVAVVNIWNVAMTALGISTISSTSENSAQADLLNDVWADFRKQWLVQNPWNGAKTTAALSTFKDADDTTAVIPAGRWSRAFTLPDSTTAFPYLHALYINGKEMTPDNKDYEIEAVANDAGTIRRCLMTDETTVKLEYLFDTKDANIDLLAPAVKHAMGLSLAAYIAPHFGKDQREISDLQVRADEAGVQAKAIDGQEGSMRKFQSNPLTDVRR